MSLQQYLTLMALATFVSYIVLASVLVYFDPFAAGTVALILFYASASLAAVGTFSLLGFFIRRSTTPQTIAFRDVVTSFRQAVLLSVLLISALLLKQLDLLGVAVVLGLIVVLTGIELFVISRKSQTLR